MTRCADPGTAGEIVWSVINSLGVDIPCGGLIWVMLVVFWGILMLTAVVAK